MPLTKIKLEDCKFMLHTICPNNLKFIFKWKKLLFLPQCVLRVCLMLMSFLISLIFTLKANNWRMETWNLAWVLWKFDLWSQCCGHVGWTHFFLNVGGAKAKVASKAVSILLSFNPFRKAQDLIRFDKNDHWQNLLQNKSWSQEN